MQQLDFYLLDGDFLSENLELTINSKYAIGVLNSKLSSLNQKSKKQGFLENFVGFKYLFFDPFKKERD